MRRSAASFSRERIATAARARRRRAEEARPARVAPSLRGAAGDRLARLPYATDARRVRERAYRSRVIAGTILAIVIHLAVTVSLAPLRQRIPLVRHIGYEGALRILPEISIQRPLGAAETELETLYGLGSESFLRVIETREVENPVEADDLSEVETGDFEEEYGEEIRRQLEQSLPQPTSRDVVVTRLVKPAYPPTSVTAGVEGVVVFRLHVSKHGRVARAWLLSSEVDVDCEEAARRAVLQWRFRPHVLAGTPVDFLVDQRIRFRLRDVLDAEAPGLRTRGR
jgi:TonB family protein